jgi:glucose/arabinose dehydrogenase
MATRPTAVLSALLVALSVLLPLASPRAHPPHDPYDDTRFAPITRFGPSIGVQVLTTGLTAPIKAVIAPGQRGRLYVVDQIGILWAVDLASGNKSVFLDLSARLVTLGVLGANTFDERGFLGVAFHPHYQQNGLLYTYTSEPNAGPPTFPTTLPAGTPADHQNVVAEWNVPNPGNLASVVNPASRRELLRVDWPQFNHDGGDLAFGPDRKLYISMGDGGGADDRDGQNFIVATGSLPIVEAPIVGHGLNGNGQNLTNPLGKIHRIDVDTRSSANGQYGIPPNNPFVNTPGALKEIWAYGFRNPFRMGFDSQTGDLYVGDVGQNDIEEVDKVVRGGNYGWNCKEGTLFFDPRDNAEGVATTDNPRREGCNVRTIDPIAQYDTHHEGHSVIGGYVYRGRALPALRGKYVFGDFSLLFKLFSGPHDYGRLFVIDPNGRGHHHHRGHAKRGHHDSPQPISQLIVLPGGALSLALLGIGQDAAGEIYVMGNISGVPFPDPATGEVSGRVLKLVPAPEADDDKHDD